MWPKLTGTGAIDPVVAAAVDEAWQRGERKVGTDHLLLGLLHDQEVAELLGVTVAEARTALAGLDQAALLQIGLDVRGLDLPTAPPQKRRRPSLASNSPTAGFRGVMSRAVADNGGRIRGLTPRHLLRSLLTVASSDPAAQVLGQLGIDPNALHARLDAQAA
jgi:hypothetical protein